MKKADINQYGNLKNSSLADVKYKKENNFKIIFKLILTVFTIFATTGMIVGMYLISYIISMSSEKIDYDLRAMKLQLTSQIYILDENGKFKEYDSVHHSEDRIWVDFKDIPDAMKNAIIAIEDKRFESHNGVDWIRTFSAVSHLFGSGSSYGGSTITQQTIKNLTEDNEVSLTRKIREIFRSINMENEYSKDEILEAYLNAVNFGSGCRGVQASAKNYFNKDISECSIAQCAAIAGITKNPAAYNPLIFPENNKKRRELVLSEMYNQGKISKQEYDDAIEESKNMTFGKVSDTDEEEVSEKWIYNWYVDAMLKEVVDDLNTRLELGRQSAWEMLCRQGLKIYCAMDENTQKAAESVIRDPNIMPKDEKLELGYIMMDFDGRVLASLGSREEKKGNLWRDRANDRQSRRQPGSAIKPLGVYAPAIDSELCHYSSFISNEKIPNFYGAGNPGPNNWDNSSGGEVFTFKAISRSLNIPAVRTLEKLTSMKSYEFLTKKLGFTSLEESDIHAPVALSLGGMAHGVTPKEMTAGFQIFGNGGIYHKPYKYFYITDRNGKVLLDNRNQVGIQAIKPETATIMNRLLTNVVQSGTGTSAAISGWRIGGKTGTTNNDNDAYFVGFSPYSVAGLWLGYEPAKKINQATTTTNIIWREIMKKFLSGKPSKDYPSNSNVVERSFCATTGKIATNRCPIGGTGYYASSNMPPVCNLHPGDYSTPPKKEEPSPQEPKEPENPAPGNDAEQPNIAQPNGENNTENTQQNQAEQ
ncbi:MAG: transglycosylase domain-containing protein [Oscillospiraceae bacterium]|jgi:penicillin-binding protein 1A|nr:transglycosylase domain-containing protein [Oscillospiraceae bacterium]